jgi:hypothetical protein
VDPVPDPLLLRKSGSAGNQTRYLWIFSQELWRLDHRCGPATARVQKEAQWSIGPRGEKRRRWKCLAIDSWLQPCGFIYGRHTFRVPAGTPAIVTDIFHDFPQSFQTSIRSWLLLCSPVFTSPVIRLHSPTYSPCRKNKLHLNLWSTSVCMKFMHFFIKGV